MNAGRFLCIVFVEVSEQKALQSVHAPFCIGVNEASPFHLIFSSQNKHPLGKARPLYVAKIAAQCNTHSTVPMVEKLPQNKLLQLKVWHDGMVFRNV